MIFEKEKASFSFGKHSQKSTIKWISSEFCHSDFFVWRLLRLKKEIQVVNTILKWCKTSPHSCEKRCDYQNRISLVIRKLEINAQIFKSRSNLKGFKDC